MNVPINKLKGNPSNPRVLRDDKFAKLKKSIEEFPDMLNKRPIVAVTDKDGKLMVLGGNMRLRACQELGLKEVPVILADDWTEEQRREFIVKDNVGFGDWDWDALANEWDAGELIDWGLDLPADFAAETTEGLTDPDEVPEVPEVPVTVLGDVWVMGKHRVMCGDSSDVLAAERLMAGKQAETVVTDPPYGINANRQTLGTGKKQFHRGDNWDAERPDIAWLQAYANKLIIWGGNYFADVLPPTNDWLCWHKKNDGLSFSEFELAWTNLGKNCRILSHHWSGEQKVHPTQKPVAVIEWCMDMTTGLVFDPFLGSGTSIIAAEKAIRSCYGMELDPKYCDVIVKRWQDFTGQKAIHEATGKTFDEMAPLVAETATKQR